MQKKDHSMDENVLPELTEEQLSQVAGGKTFDKYQYDKSHKQQIRRYNEVENKGFKHKTNPSNPNRGNGGGGGNF